MTMPTALRNRERILPVRSTYTELVDKALWTVLQREFLTREEALMILRAIVAAISEPTLAVTAASLVDDALTSYGDSLLVGRSQVIDPLLDLRFALMS
jgi:hypothetical protein